MQPGLQGSLDIHLTILTYEVVNIHHRSQFLERSYSVSTMSHGSVVRHEYRRFAPARNHSHDWASTYLLADRISRARAGDGVVSALELVNQGSGLLLLFIRPVKKGAESWRISR
jgi:hypothetical protein